MRASNNKPTGRFMVLAVTTLSLASPLLSEAANLVVNGSFEAVQIGSPFLSANPADIPGWTHSGSQGDALLWAIGYADGGGSVTVAGDGRQFVTMGGGYFQAPAPSAWDQTLTGLTVGGVYDLSFKIASEADYSGAQSVLVDFPSGSPTAGQTFTASFSPGHYWQNWNLETMTFTANSTSVDLRFSAATSFDVGLDNVSVTSARTPEASSTFILLAVATAGLAAMRRALTPAPPVV